MKIQFINMRIIRMIKKFSFFAIFTFNLKIICQEKTENPGRGSFIQQTLIITIATMKKPGRKLFLLSNRI